MDLSIETKHNDGIIFGIVPDEVKLRGIEIGAGTKADHPRKGWVNKPMTVDILIESLTQHRVGQKDGPCLLQGSVVGGERRATAVRALDLLVLDMDTGESPEAVCSKIEDLGLFAIVHSSHSHMKNVSSIKKTALMKWCGKPDENPNIEDAVNYLLKEKKYQPSVLDGAELITDSDQTPEGVQMVIKHQPMPKFRVVFVLEKPFVVAERHADQQRGILEWKERYAGASRMIGAYFDRACVDPSRLFYLPRHAKGAPFFTWVLAGKLLDVESLDRVTKEQLDQESRDVFEQEAESVGGSNSSYRTANLKKFASLYSERFNIEEFIQDRGFDQRGHGSGGGAVFQCPNDDFHSNAGSPDDKGFWCKNGDGEPFAAKCQHTACSKLDRLDFIDLACQHGDDPIKDAEKLRAWVDQLQDEPDDKGWDAPFVEQQRLNDLSSKPVVGFESSKDVLREMSAITKDTPQEEIFFFAKRIGASTVADGEKLTLYDTLASKTGFRKQTFRSLAKEYEAEVNAKRKLKAFVEKHPGSISSRTMADWNKEYAVVTLGNSVKIMAKAETPGEVPAFISLHDFMLQNSNCLVPEIDSTTNKPKLVSQAKQWLEWEGRDSYKKVVFEPSLSPEEAAKNKVFNIWQGFPVEGKEGDWSLLHDHIRDNICQGDANAYVWLMTWISQIYQQPGKKLGSAVAIRGKKGVGKSKLFDWIKRTMGPQAIKVSHRSHITGNFNSHQATCVLMVCEEAFWAGDNASGGILKDLITSPTTMMEKKGVDVIEVANCLRLAMLSNEDWVVPAGLDDERRFFVLECSDARIGQTKFFSAIDKQMENGGMEAMVHFFQNWVPEDHDIVYGGISQPMEWDLLRKPLNTRWLKEQAIASLGADERFFFNIAQTGCATGLNETPDIILHTNERTNIPLSLLMTHYNAFLRTASYSKQPIGNISSMMKHAATWLLAEKELVTHPIEEGEKPEQHVIVESWDRITLALEDKGITVDPVRKMTHQELAEKLKESRAADTPLETVDHQSNVFALESKRR